MERAGAEVMEALRVAQMLKEQAVRREGVGTDIPPLLHLLKEGVPLGTATLIGEREETLKDIAGIIGLSEADQVVHVSDAYATYSAVTVPDHGSLARAFGDGNPDVIECLNAASVRRDGTAAVVQSCYTYDGRRVVWADPVDIADNDDIDPEMAGEVPAAILIGFKAQEVRPIAPLNPPEIAAIVGCDFVVPMMESPPRNSPCPCGSGVKAKLCCWA